MKPSVAAALVLLVLGGLAAPQSSRTDVKLRSVTRLVQITVIAQDNQGHPIIDLTRDDFVLFDSGKPRDIKVFTMDRSDREKPAAVAAQADPSEHIFTNTELERSGPNGVTVILLDSLNTQWTDQARATRSAIRFLSQIHPDDHVAIYSIGLTGLRVLHDFTTDASDLVAQLASWKGEIPRAKSPDLGDQLASVLSGRDRGSRLNQRRAPAGDSRSLGQTIPTLRVMEILASRLTGIPGRKNVIWISNGFPAAAISADKPVLVSSLDPRNTSNTVTDTMGESANFAQQLNHAMHLLDSANVSIYPIEARGLQTYRPGITGRPQVPLESWVATTPAVIADQATQQAMQEIAQRTGGRAFILANDISGAIRTAIDDSRVTYTLGFYPESARLDGKFHPITIKLAERRGITLRYRKGYIDTPDAPGDPKQRRNDLEHAALSPLDANAIPLTARLSPSKAGGYNLNLNISLSGLSLLQDGEIWTGEVEVFLVERDQRGQEFGRVNDTIAMRLKQATYDQMLKTGAPYQHAIMVSPKADVLRVVVRDAGSGDLGSLTIPTAALVR